MKETFRKLVIFLSSRTETGENIKRWDEYEQKAQYENARSLVSCILTNTSINALTRENR